MKRPQVATGHVLRAPSRNKGPPWRAGRRAASRPAGRETFPGRGGDARGHAGPAALTSSMAATVFRHCAVRVVKLEAVGAL